MSPFHAFAHIVVLPPSRIVSHSKRNSLVLYPLIHPPRKPFSLGRGRILIPGFIRSPPTLIVWDVAHSFPLGGADRDFPFIEVETIDALLI